MSRPLLRLAGVSKVFASPGRSRRRSGAGIPAVDEVDLEVFEGETLGLVGESGCGKSTLGRCMLRLYELSGGEIVFDGRDISHLGARRLRPLRREMQMIFQDPYSSLNPRRTVGAIIGTPIRIHCGGRRDEVAKHVTQLLELVGLSQAHAARYPHEFSSGQRQRIAVARAIAVSPRLIVADEPVSALDVSIQAQVLNLLRDLQGRLGLTYVFIAHDLAVVRHMADRIAVMYLGRIVELGVADQVVRAPAHPYTQILLSAVPIPDPESRGRRRMTPRADLEPTPVDTGCRFHPRCPRATDVCRAEVPALSVVSDARAVACHHPTILPNQAQATTRSHPKDDRDPAA